ncbi:T9SS type A sorting domain-containing protein [uncultured Polaribacter sp.]|uniref:T9SS type A sorting domain-containing protein n=1 Tax=uncultured Polaribacter sp. TaxID=174711 RepID=UPI0030DBEE3D|tara:strand:+ start:12327 stop:15236 length:2910 start_codon:yes stop_codon:yes gene_type:complete
MKKKLILFTFCALCINLNSQVQVASDINKGTNESSLKNFFEFNNQLFFSAEIADQFSNSIRKLWTTDGTENGTSQIENLPDKDYFVTDNFLYYMEGREIWKSDGTEANSTQIKENLDLNEPLGAFKDFFYYLEYADASYNIGLYKTDGNSTDLLLTFPADQYASNNIANNGNAIFKLDENRFIAYIYTKNLGIEPYISDGSVAGTYFLKDVGVNTFQTVNAIPSNFYKATDKFLFLNGKKELWTTDGTEAGTLKLKTFTGSSSLSILGMTSYNNKVYFAYTHELWETDGTEPGTKLVLSNVNDDGGIQGIINRNNELLLLLERGIHIFDGTSTNTTKLTTPDISYIRQYNTSTSTKTYFVANYKNQGDRVWITDGTNTGTYSLNPFWPDGRTPTFGMYTLGENLIFSGTLGSYDIGELWISDGTNTGTKLLKDINKTGNLDSEPKFQTELNGKIYFAADDNIHGRELFVFDGTSTSLVKDINPGFQSSNPFDFYLVNNKLFFKAYTLEKGYELWVTDGKETGTKIVKDINPTGDAFVNDGRAYVRIGEFSQFNNELYFYADNGTNGMEPWKSDGTEAGTIMLKDINSGANPSFRPALDVRPKFVPYNNEMYFFAVKTGTENSATKTEMWKTNGTSSGTILVSPVNSLAKEGTFYTSNLFTFNNLLYFNAEGRFTRKRNLIKTDGTTAGTKIVTELKSNTEVYPLKNKIYYLFDDRQGAGEEIWAIDKDDNTALVKDIVEGSQGINPTNFYIHNDCLYFAIRNKTYQTELWRLSDTTEPKFLYSKEFETGTSSIDDYFGFVSNGNKLFINTRHYGNSDFIYRMYFVENTGILTPVLSINNADVSYGTESGGLQSLSAFIDNNYYFTGSYDDKGEELLITNLSAVLSLEDFDRLNPDTSFKFIIYPNPANKMLNIQSNSKIKSGNIYNLLGKKIDTIKSSAIDVSKFQSGIYILKLEDELGNISSKKWIRQ